MFKEIQKHIKIKNYIFVIFLVIIAGLISVSCAVPEEDTEEDDVATDDDGNNNSNDPNDNNDKKSGIYFKFEGVGLWAYCDKIKSDCSQGGWPSVSSGETIAVDASDYAIWSAKSDDVYEEYYDITAESCDSGDRYYTINRESFSQSITVSDSGCQTNNDVPGSNDNTNDNNNIPYKAEYDLMSELLGSWQFNFSIGDSNYQESLVFNNEPEYNEEMENFKWSIFGTINETGAVNCFPLSSLESLTSFDIWCYAEFTNGDSDNWAFSINGNSLSGNYAYAIDGENGLSEALYNSDSTFSGFRTNSPIDDNNNNNNMGTNLVETLWEGSLEYDVTGGEAAIMIGFVDEEYWIGMQAISLYGVIYKYDLIGVYTIDGDTVTGVGKSKPETDEEFDDTPNILFTLTLSSNGQFMNGSWSEGNADYEQADMELTLSNDSSRMLSLGNQKNISNTSRMIKNNKGKSIFRNRNSYSNQNGINQIKKNFSELID